MLWGGSDDPHRISRFHQAVPEGWMGDADDGFCPLTGGTPFQADDTILGGEIMKSARGVVTATPVSSRGTIYKIDPLFVVEENPRIDVPPSESMDPHTKSS